MTNKDLIDALRVVSNALAFYSDDENYWSRDRATREPIHPYSNEIWQSEWMWPSPLKWRQPKKPIFKASKVLEDGGKLAHTALSQISPLLKELEKE